ncbi:MAG: 2Fe-2S iron-sulfur cluster-binding protein, partial [Alphaproteobacteria bacterium]|nr:2Fe-2S iron-sulfur cluster-binding protein [Alphaproteobacteria bacterium]
MQRQRLASGGRLDRSKKIAFQFDGKRLTGYAGDTLASALLANGVRLVGRSFKYHRPRGLYAAGVEEPNALVELRKGAHKEPNTLATVAELFDGLVANSQNNWPSLRFDLMGVSNRLSPLLSVGFYYKTFMWPRSWWLRYESLIRKAAGMGAASSEPDPDSYEHAHDFCDVLVVGAGPAGIAAAVAAVEAGARTILVEQDFAAGGSLLAAAPTLDGDAADDWLRERLSYLDRHEAARVMLRTTAFGCYDHNVVGLIERVSDHVTKPPAYRPRQRLWTVRAEHLIVAAGSFERPFVFANNDLPGVMLASAAKTYCRRFAVRPGGKAVVFTNNDSAYAVIDDLLSAGVRVEAVVDTRSVIDARRVSAASRHGTEILNGFAVTEAGGKRHLKRVTVHPFDGRGIVGHGASRTVDCDLLLMSAGWSPTLHLHSQTGAKPVYEAAIAGFAPGESAANHHVVGAAAGLWGFEAVIESGRLAGRSAATGRQCDIPGRALRNAINVEPLWEVPSPKSGSVKKFVDLQNDVTASDIRQAEGEGYGFAEHLKRYTALAMGTDQGKLSAVNGMALMAAARRVAISDVGTTTFRPPFTPVAVGALAGRVRGKHYRPARVTPMHCWHESNGARLMQTGAWLRPRCYLRNGESEEAAYRREAAAVRSKVGLVDISSLGKIDVQGPDAGEFLDRVYVNKWRTFRVNRAKYGVMLRDDGIVLDD